jgi:Vestigial/Tondu family
MSANCVVFTNYSSGDAAAEVDEHFSRALGSISKQQVRKT